MTLRSTPPPELVEFLQPYDPAIQKLALKIRSLVLEELAPCHENIYDAYNAVAIGYGLSDRLRDGVCHIAVYAKHVNLGFNRGATLNDPQGILKGGGKSIRHITLNSMADLAKPEIRAYLQRARDQATVGSTNNTKVTGVVSVVKAVYPNKRRPNKKVKGK
jgi:hypothetical protein